MEMSNEGDRTKAVQYFLDAIKVLLPFGGAVWAVFALQGSANEERAMMREQIRSNTEKIAELTDENKAQRAQMQINTISLTEVKTDLINIKDDTKETLDLVRAYVGSRRN